MALGKKTGGRVAGTPNKNHLQIVELFEELDYEPAVEAIKILKSGALEPEVAINSHLKLMKFKYAERKAVEHTGKDGEKLISLEEVIFGNPRPAPDSSEA